MLTFRLALRNAYTSRTAVRDGSLASLRKAAALASVRDNNVTPPHWRSVIAETDVQPRQAVARNAPCSTTARRARTRGSVSSERESLAPPLAAIALVRGIGFAAHTRQRAVRDLRARQAKREHHLAPEARAPLRLVAKWSATWRRACVQIVSASSPPRCAPTPPREGEMRCLLRSERGATLRCHLRHRSRRTDVRRLVRGIPRGRLLAPHQSLISPPTTRNDHP